MERKAFFLAPKGRIVTFGITPDSPKTGFSCINQGKALGNDGFNVDRFVEKLTYRPLRPCFRRGGYSWNSGMSLFRASVYLNELQTVLLKCMPVALRLGKARGKSFFHPARQAFMDSPSDSIDYTIMEHTKLAVVCPLSLDWNDLSSWEAFYQAGVKDKDGNVYTGNIVQKNVRNYYLHGTHRLIVDLDVSELVVVETQDSILVASRSSVQGVKHILKVAESPEYKFHPLGAVSK